MKNLSQTNVLVTRQDAPSYILTSHLRKYNYKIVNLPIIKQIIIKHQITKLEKLIPTITSGDWLIFTSRYSLTLFIQTLHKLNFMDHFLLKLPINFALVGPSIKNLLYEKLLNQQNSNQTNSLLSLETKNIFMPPKSFSSASLASHLKKHLPKNQTTWLITPQKNISPPNLVDPLIKYLKSASNCQLITPYKSVSRHEQKDKLNEILTNLPPHSWLTFTSPSAVKAFFAMINNKNIILADKKFALIGPSTKSAFDIYYKNITPLVANPSTLETLAQKIYLADYP
ncbi:MAG: uroporphyrinogen-III synthase [SAR324 cluster bacterium]|nr:uroporphyrinogen-III synthase [SAR324 cluster bacterium]